MLAVFHDREDMFASVVSRGPSECLVDPDFAWKKGSFVAYSDPDQIRAVKLAIDHKKKETFRKNSGGPLDPDRPRTDQVFGFLWDYLQKPGNEVGGSLHIYTDDGNVLDWNIESCLRWAIERNDIDAVFLCEWLLLMSISQRNRLLGMVEEYDRSRRKVA